MARNKTKSTRSTRAMSAEGRDQRAPAVPPLDGEGPKWLQVRRALAGPIVNGAWPPGTRIPTEASLTSSFDTSRVTISKAIQSLAADGLVQRRRKVGTIVAERALERPVFEIWDIADLVARKGGTYGYQLLECARIEHDQRRELLGVSARTPVLWVRCLHICNDKPFQLEERLINIDAAPGAACHLFKTQGPSRWLVAHVRWMDAEHNISAREAPEEIAAHLGVHPHAACLVVDRRTWNHGIPVTHARLWHPGSSHTLVGHFKPPH